MLVIRNEQLKALNEPFERKFVEELATRLQATLPEQTAELSDVELRTRIREIIPRAVWYGIEQKPDVATFVALEFEFGPLFELAPEREWALQILDRDPLPGEARLAIVEQRLRLKLA